ncbi:Inhibitor of growth protein 4 [Acipenser ruthenus]|uniref:Inhibitor of growth protein 4 n=1 Tax=Acipenser ruthenus TaxID=7906 RepID=A0A444UNJ9_ACIRT|nr:Inhibitor of growth protein 4 [Acipenser ruthenus]
MAAGMYLEHYLDSIENLPFELQRNFQLMRDLDQRTEGIENLPFELQRNFQLMRDLDQRTEDMKGEIDGLATEYTANARTLSSEQKLSLLRQIQESYTKCKEFGDDKVQLAMQTYEMVDKHIRRLDTDLARTEYSAPAVTFGNVHPSDVLDMPVDPNEPTYCLCHQVSYGEMIGCDNPDCSIEWFHFACVGLTTKPRGKW